MRADGHRVESICEVLREQGLRVVPRSYRVGVVKSFGPTVFMNFGPST